MNSVTVSPYDFPMEVVGEFIPEERPILWPTGRAHPGAPAAFNIVAVHVNGIDIKNMLDDDQYTRIEDCVLHQLEH